LTTRMGLMAARRACCWRWLVASLALGASIASAEAPTPVRYSTSTQRSSVTLANGYVQITFDLLCPRISALRADAQGSGRYGDNVLISSTGVRLEVQQFDASGCVGAEDLAGEDGAMPALSCPYAATAAHSSSREGCLGVALAHEVVTNSSREVSVLISGVVESVDRPQVRSSWLLTLRSGARGAELEVNATSTRAANLTAVRLSHDFAPRSLYALYDKGVVQMMNAPKPYWGAPPGNPLRRFYALGGVGVRGGAVEVLPLPGRGTADAVVVARGSWNAGQSGATGLQLILAGNFSTTADSCAFRPGLYPKLPGSPLGWRARWENAAPTLVAKDDTWTATACLLANDYAYPPSNGGDIGSCEVQPHTTAPVDGVVAVSELEDHASVLSAVYGSAMGTMTSFVNHPLGAVVGGLASPVHFAEGSYNNFDIIIAIRIAGRLSTQ
jgi:hypothetical protein